MTICMHNSLSLLDHVVVKISILSIIENYLLICYFQIDYHNIKVSRRLYIMYTIKEIEQILAKLQYFDLHFVNHDTHTDTYAYDGYLDTYYRIHVKLIGEEKMEIWDCVYDEENFVKAGTAHFVDGTWNVAES